MEIVIGNILRWGVVIAAAIGAVGVAASLLGSGSTVLDFRHFTGDAATGLRAIIQSALSGNARGIMQLGIAFLIVTPVVRVALSLVAFARERDRTYVLLTLLVLVLLLYGLAGGSA